MRVEHPDDGMHVIGHDDEFIVVQANFLAVVADDGDEIRAGLGVIPDYLSKRLSGAF